MSPVMAFILYCILQYIWPSSRAVSVLMMVSVKLSNTDTLGPIKCVLIRKVSSFQGANNMKLGLGQVS